MLGTLCLDLHMQDSMPMPLCFSADSASLRQIKPRSKLLPLYTMPQILISVSAASCGAIVYCSCL